MPRLGPGHTVTRRDDLETPDELRKALARERERVTVIERRTAALEEVLKRSYRLALTPARNHEN